MYRFSLKWQTLLNWLSTAAIGGAPFDFQAWAWKMGPGKVFYSSFEWSCCCCCIVSMVGEVFFLKNYHLATGFWGRFDFFLNSGWGLFVCLFFTHTHKKKPSMSSPPHIKWWAPRVHVNSPKYRFFRTLLIQRVIFPKAIVTTGYWSDRVYFQ